MSRFGDDWGSLLELVCERTSLGWKSLCAQFGTGGAIGMVVAGVVMQGAIVIPAAARYFAPAHPPPTLIELSLLTR